MQALPDRFLRLPVLRRICFRTFRAVKRHRWLVYSVPLLVTAGMLKYVDYLIQLHDWPKHFELPLGTATSLIVWVGWLVPLFIIDHAERCSLLAIEKIEAILMERQLHQPPGSAVPSGLDGPTARSVATSIIDDATSCTEKPLYIFTWNFLYIWSEEERGKRLTKHKGQVRKVLNGLSDKADLFRGVLQTFPNDLYIIVPDLGSAQVEGLIAERAKQVDNEVSEAELLEAARLGWRWARRLKKIRPPGKTHILRLKAPLSGRMLLSGRRVFFQQYGDKKLGVLSPVTVVDSEKDPIDYSILVRCTKAVADLLQ